MNLLSALRPQALTMLEEIAEAYHDKFARPFAGEFSGEAGTISACAAPL